MGLVETCIRTGIFISQSVTESSFRFHAAFKVFSAPNIKAAGLLSNEGKAARA